jgi:hypothetical protein
MLVKYVYIYIYIYIYIYVYIYIGYIRDTMHRNYVIDDGLLTAGVKKHAEDGLPSMLSQFRESKKCLKSMK